MIFWGLYNLIILFIFIFLKIKSVFDKNIFDQFTVRNKQLVKIKEWRKVNHEKKIINFHCASLGEFELIIPLANEFKKKQNVAIVYSFFSPSGFINCQVDEHDLITYLPIDFNKSVHEYVYQLGPDLVIIAKYEFWLNFLTVLAKEKIPYAFVNINILHFPWILQFPKAKALLNNAAYIGATNDITFDKFSSNGIKRISCHLDLRYTRSLTVQSTDYEVPNNHGFFLQQENLIVCGSIWPQDLELLLPLINDPNSSLIWLLAPHKVDHESIGNIRNRLIVKSQLFSKPTKNNRVNVLLVDTIGDLKYLYQFANYIYIGGGFKTGLHNVIEGVIHNVPVFIGKRYHNYPEAVKLVKSCTIFSVSSLHEFKLKINKRNSLKFNPLNLSSNEIEKDLKQMTMQFDKILSND